MPKTTDTEARPPAHQASSTAVRIVPLVQRCINHVVELTDRVLETDLTSDQRGRLTMAQSTAASVLELISDTSDLALLETEGLDLDRVRFNLPELVKDTVSASIPVARARKAQLHLLLDPDLPQSAVGDPGRLRQLLGNTLAFALERSMRGRVSLSAYRSEDVDGEPRISFEIVHSGAVLSADDLQGVLGLHALEQGTLSTRLATELGLAIAARLTMRMGGELEADTSGNQAVLRCANLEVGTSHEIDDLFVDDAGSQNALSVLVATDDYGRVLQVQPLLDSAGVRLASVCRVDEAVALLALTSGSVDSPDAILLYALDEADTGASLLASSGTLAKIPSIVVVQRGQRGDAVKFKQHGLAGYLTEPVDPVGLGEALRAAVAIRRSGGSEFVTSHYLRDNRKKLRILIADDSGISRKLAAEVLERRGHTVVVADNGRDAINAWLERPFDVLVLDLEMPELGGLDTCRQILELASTGEPPTILGMTTHATDEDVQRAQGAGMAGCLAKPFRLEELFVAVERAASGDRNQPGMPSHPVAAGERVIDVQAAIEQIGGLAMFSECVVELKKELPDLIASIERANADSDFEAVASAAHRLRGGLATVVAIEASNACRAVELAARADDKARVGREILRLNSAAARLTPELDAFIVD